MKEEYGIIIQARMGSSRLPGKVLLPFKGSTILGVLIEKLQMLNIPIVVATPKSDSNNELAGFLTNNSINVFRGNENDVLSRFIEVGKRFGFKKIIRVCADNPFLDLNFLRELINISQKNPAYDYLSFSYNKRPTILSHFGIFAEIVSLNALQKIHKDYPCKNEYREHVTIGVYQHPELFNILLHPLNEEFGKFDGVRLTIDTISDYNNILYIEDKLKTNPETKFITIANFILENSDILKSMKEIIQSNKK